MTRHSRFSGNTAFGLAAIGLFLTSMVIGPFFSTDTDRSVALATCFVGFGLGWLVIGVGQLVTGYAWQNIADRNEGSHRNENPKRFWSSVALDVAVCKIVSKTKASTKAQSKTADAAQASTGKLLLTEEMRNVGFADPASTYQTLQWAKMKEDTNDLQRAGLVRAKYGSASEFILHLSDRSKPHEDRDILVSSRILQENVSGEEANLQIEYNWADGSTTTGPMTFVRIGNDWRQALNFDPPAVGKMNSGLQTEGAALENQPVSK